MPASGSGGPLISRLYRSVFQVACGGERRTVAAFTPRIWRLAWRYPFLLPLFLLLHATPYATGCSTRVATWCGGKALFTTQTGCRIPWRYALRFFRGAVMCALRLSFWPRYDSDSQYRRAAYLSTAGSAGRRPRAVNISEGKEGKLNIASWQAQMASTAVIRRFLPEGHEPAMAATLSSPACLFWRRRRCRVVGALVSEEQQEESGGCCCET